MYNGRRIGFLKPFSLPLYAVLCRAVTWRESSESPVDYFPSTRRGFPFFCFFFLPYVRRSDLGVSLSLTETQWNRRDDLTDVCGSSSRSCLLLNPLKMFVCAPPSFSGGGGINKIRTRERERAWSACDDEWRPHIYPFFRQAARQTRCAAHFSTGFSSSSGLWRMNISYY